MILPHPWSKYHIFFFYASWPRLVRHVDWAPSSFFFCHLFRLNTSTWSSEVGDLRHIYSEGRSHMSRHYCRTLHLVYSSWLHLLSKTLPAIHNFICGFLQHSWLWSLSIASFNIYTFNHHLCLMLATSSNISIVNSFIYHLWYCLSSMASYVASFDVWLLLWDN